MAFDIGTRRTGVAVSCSTGKNALALRTLHHNGQGSFGESPQSYNEFISLIRKYNPKGMIFGWPLDLWGKENVQTMKTKRIVNNWMKFMISSEVIFLLKDERFTSLLVEDQHYKSNQKDAETARLILQEFLDFRSANNRSREVI